ncbi:MAG: PhnD/SsuA/transferrin family substrate-binding protein [Deltaproteobacteria bacterium]|nr:PhnD/SsuA/transferrin family substrate-binding protein [Deltaproteobacteria bacterium]
MQRPRPYASFDSRAAAAAALPTPTPPTPRPRVGRGAQIHARAACRRRLSASFDSRAAAVLAVTAALAVAVTSTPAVAKPTPVVVAVVYLGGPDAGAEGKALIDDLVDHLEETTGVEAGTFVGAYFNETAPAARHLQKNKDAFILGSLGFYLANRAALGLKPLATLSGNSGTDERHSVVVKKGRFASLEALRHKRLYGSPLYEAPAYVNRVIFAGRLDAATHFDLKPTSRPLSALRKLEKDEADAVLVNEVQLESLRRLPLFEKLQVVFTSAPQPALSLMVASTPRTDPLVAKVQSAVLALCATPAGEALCKNFGILGFAALEPGALDAVTKLYETGL